MIIESSVVMITVLLHSVSSPPYSFISIETMLPTGIANSNMKMPYIISFFFIHLNAIDTTIGIRRRVINANTYRRIPLNISLNGILATEAPITIIERGIVALPT